MYAQLVALHEAIYITKVYYATKYHTLCLLVSTVNIVIYHSKDSKDFICINLDVEEIYVQEHPHHHQARSETIDLQKNVKDFQSLEKAPHFKTQT